MKNIISKNNVFSLIQFLGGCIGLILTLGWIILARLPLYLRLLLGTSLLILFLTTVLYSSITFYQISNKNKLSNYIKNYHRLNLIVEIIIWFICVPFMLGVGSGQFFFIMSGFIFFCLPSFVILVVHNVALFPSNPEKSWHTWIEENALDDNIKE